MWVATILLVVLSLPAAAQNLAATWQGTLGHDPGQRIVIRVTPDDRAQYYEIDKSGDDVPGAVAPSGSTITMSFHALNATFRGHLADDGNSIVGTWAENTTSQPLTLTRPAAGAEWVIPKATLPAAMDLNADPAFEVATIKPAAPSEQRKYFLISPDHIKGVNETVEDMFIFAYGMHRKQIVGAPSWAESEKFDLSAKPDTEGRPSIDQWRVMMRKLLAERFRLTFHQEQREIPVYLLSLGSGGTKLTPSQGDPKGMPGIGFQTEVGDLAAFNTSMAFFLNYMNRNAGLDRPLVDRTGLTGKYDFKLKWTPDDAPRPTGNEDVAPSLPTALDEQLGLKLTATKAVTDVYILDHIEKPSAN